MAKQHSPRFLAIATDSKTRVRECTIEDLKSRLDQSKPIVLIDVREESEFAVGHIPGAIHLSKGVIERDIEAVVPDLKTEILPATSSVTICSFTTRVSRSPSLSWSRAASAALMKTACGLRKICQKLSTLPAVDAAASACPNHERS